METLFSMPSHSLLALPSHLELVGITFTFLNCILSRYQNHVACFLKEILKRLQLSARAVCDTGIVYEVGENVFTSFF